MARRDDLELAHGATTKARENAVKQDRVQATNAIRSSGKAWISAPDGVYRRDSGSVAARCSRVRSPRECRRVRPFWRRDVYWPCLMDDDWIPGGGNEVITTASGIDLA